MRPFAPCLFFSLRPSVSSFFFNDTAPTEIYTLSLHDALPICIRGCGRCRSRGAARGLRRQEGEDRKSTRLNSSHANISYAVFCLKKKTVLAVLDSQGNLELEADEVHKVLLADSEEL